MDTLDLNAASEYHLRHQVLVCSMTKLIFGICQSDAIPSCLEWGAD